MIQLLTSIGILTGAAFIIGLSIGVWL